MRHRDNVHRSVAAAQRDAARAAVWTALALLAMFAAGCSINMSPPRLWIETRTWYNTTEIVIPFGTDGEYTRHAEYRYEFFTGTEWVVGIEEQIVVPKHENGLLRFTAEPTAADHRLTVSLLDTSGPGGVLEPVDTVVNQFGIDTVPPEIVPGFGLILAPPPGSYDGATDLEVTVDHVEFTAPTGSKVTVYATVNGEVPDERNERIDGPRQFHLWGPSDYVDRTLRFIAVDEAGNRSGVFTATYWYF